MTQANAVSLLVREMRENVELDVKVQTASNMVIVGLSVGPEQATQLLENLDEVYAGQPEEVQVSVSCRLGQLLRVTSYDVKNITSQSVNAFLRHLEALSLGNSHLVSRGLCCSLQEVLGFVEDKAPFVSLVQRLLQSQITQQRALCAVLIPEVYGALPNTDQQHRPTLGTAFGSLVSDADSYVRQQAAVGLRALIKRALEQPTADKFAYSPSYIFVCYDRLVQDLQDGVRAENAPNGVQVLRFLLQLQKNLEQDARETKEIKEVLPALIKNISRGSSDRYWRVRLHCALQMPLFFELISRKLDVQDCAMMFKLLSEDCEQDVRIHTLRNAPAIVKFLDQTTVQQIYCPALAARAIEKETVKVKAELSRQLGSILRETAGPEQPAKETHDSRVPTRGWEAPKTPTAGFGEECQQAVSLTVQECWRKLYLDKSSEVRLEVVAGLGSFPPSEQKFVFEVLTQVIQAKGEKWTVRLSAVRALRRLNSAYPADAILSFIEESIALLNDEAYQVRQEYAETIGDVADNHWATFSQTITLVEKIVKNARSNTSNFQNRVSCTVALTAIINAMVGNNSQAMFDVTGPALITLSQDLCVFVRQQVVTGIRTVLERAADVNYLPSHAAELIRKIFTITETDEAKEIQDEIEELLGVLEAFE